MTAWIVDKRTGCIMARCDDAAIAHKLLEGYFTPHDAEGVQHYEVTDKQPASPGYRIGSDGRSITCLTCFRQSWNQNDVRNLYCGYCKRFHTPEGP